MFLICLMFFPVIRSQIAKDHGRIFIAAQLLLGKWVYLIVIMFTFNVFSNLAGVGRFLMNVFQTFMSLDRSFLSDPMF